MALSSEEKKQIADRFNTIAPDAKCPLCGNNQWSLTDGLMFLVIQEKYPNIQLSGRGLPLIAIGCKRCGNTHLINLITLGLSDVLKAIKEGNLEPQEEEK